MSIDGGTAVGIGGLAVAAFSLWFSDRSATWREERSAARADLERRRMTVERAGETLAQTMALISDVNPQRWLFNAGPQAGDIVQTWVERWATLRIGLLTLAVSLPTPEERDLAQQLQVALNNSLVSSSQYGIALPGEAAWSHDEVIADHLATKQLAERLVELMHTGVTSL